MATVDDREETGGANGAGATAEARKAREAPGDKAGDTPPAKVETEATSGPGPAGRRASGENSGAGSANNATDPAGASTGFGLSSRLLLLTLLGVMLAEVLVFIPSIANFRKTWLMERLRMAQVAALAVEFAPDGQLPPMLRQELLKNVNAKLIAFRRNSRRRLVVAADMPAVIDAHYDLREPSSFELLGDALGVFVAPGGRTIRIYARPSQGEGDLIEMVIPEAPLRAAMVEHGLNILGLSIVISAFAATLVYLALNWLLVRPMTRMVASMERFAEAPHDATRIISPSERSDEIGIAERELASMQRELSAAITHKNRLAELGLAVSKINHDMRNMLASAQLISDRLSTIDDPIVKRFAPKLLNSLSRAIRLSTETLRFGRTREAAPVLADLAVAGLMREVGDDLDLANLGAGETGIVFEIDVPEGLKIQADYDQMFRVFSNLVRNAGQALTEAGTAAPAIRVVARRARDGGTVIDVADNGPGIPEKTRRKLFKAFQGSDRKGGIGLGLAIAQELIVAHGGTLELAGADGPGQASNGTANGHARDPVATSGRSDESSNEASEGSGPGGTTFRITLPARST